MSHSFIYVSQQSVIQTERCRLNAHCARSPGFVCLASASLLTLCLIPGSSANCQASSNASPTQNTAQSSSSSSFDGSADQSDSSEKEPDGSTGLGGLAPQSTLSAEQITNILQQSPDLVLELKAQLADRMQLQGIQVDITDISDETLYRQIATNANLRANITTVLRARGYVTENDFQSSGLGKAGKEIPNPQSASQDSLLTGNGATPSGEGSADTDSAGPLTATAPSMRQGRARLSQRDSSRIHEKTNLSTDEPTASHQPTPYDLQAMRDLYTQIPDETAGLKRFGSDVFINRDTSAAGRGISTRDTPLDVPLGPDYVVGPGDALTIHLWGGTTQSIARTVDRDGTIFLPETGSVDIAGLPLGKAQTVIEGALKQQFRDAHVAVTVSRLRSVRIYVVGDVQWPGGYDISSLSTPVGALYSAGGPTNIGSLRTLLHYRGKQLIEEVDLYDFLLHGVRNGSAPFESGDTLLVPPAGSLVAVSGAVKRPAIYELKAGETTLGKVVDDAGGFNAAASIGNIRIERIDAHHERETITLHDPGDQHSEADQNAVAAFTLKDGDRIRIEPILPYSQRAVYLAGHFVRPGRVGFTEGMRLGDVLRSYQELLPEPAPQGEIVRLVPPDLHAETIEFSVPDILMGNSNVDLRPFDTIRVLGRYQADAPTVAIRGEVLRPGKYPMSQRMTAAQLVRMAGGFKRDALVGSADLTSYEIKNGNELVESLSTVPIGAAVDGTDPNADVALKPGDILAIHQITNWENLGESVTVSGQVRFPGSYGFQDGERLSSVLRRAGRLLPTAYPMGAVLIRTQVRELEQTSRDELVRQIEANSASARLSPNLASGNSPGTLQLIKAQQDQVLTDLKSHSPTGRMVIHITADIDTWANTPADIELRQGDALTIPKRPGFVLVSGQVYNATALTFAPGKTAAWYLTHAGGTNATANRKEIFIIRANGSVVGRRSAGWFGDDVLSTKLNPGDVVVVPQKILGGSLFWRNLLTAAQLASSIAITSGVAAATL
jgi:protein involved in polysaccharide export with SLBB domain